VAAGREPPCGPHVASLNTDCRGGHMDKSEAVRGHMIRSAPTPHDLHLGKSETDVT
jgi:hypothetical protein